MRDTRCEKRNGGFTLTEAVVASTLLVIAMVPILKALTSAQVTNTIIERRTRSLALAQAKLEEIRATSIYNYSAVFVETSAPLEGSYLCSVTDTGPSTELRTISVSVGCDENGDSNLGASETQVTLTTLLAQRW